MKKYFFKILLIFILISLINSIIYFFHFFVNISKKKEKQEFHEIEYRIYIFIFLVIFSKLILKHKIYRHQKLSLYISLICFVFISFFNIIKIDVSADALFNVLNIIKGIGGSLMVVLIKDLILNYYVSPYLCLLLSGIFQTIFIIIIIYIIYSLIPSEYFSIISNDYTFSEKKIIVAYIIIIYFSYLSYSY